jgi:dienelactone hydrolase
MNWIGQPEETQGMVAREFAVTAQGRQVPGMLWTPPGDGQHPLVLVGHGGSQHKRDPGIVDVAGRFVRRHGFAVVAIDGPIHGSRRSDGQSGPAVQAEFRGMWEQDHRIDAMVSDWRATLDSLLETGKVDATRIAWYGISMGTAYGLPLLAVEPRVKVALLGMWGTNFPNSQRLADDAPQVRCPVLFQMKWDDQFFTREGQFDLFNRLGSEHKWLKTYPGAHVAVAGEQLDDIEDFVARKLMA